MKSIIYIASILISLVFGACGEKDAKNANTTNVVQNGISTTTFKVWGNCEMCKETIENSLKVEGISKADWNVETNMITVSFDTSKVSIDVVKKNIAAVITIMINLKDMIKHMLN